MVKVTLYITCFNYENYVEKAIQSALNQHFDDYEILIFDDGSSDGSRERIEKYKDNDKIKVFFQENCGLVKTSNKALQEAKGKYIMRLDADDFLDENALSTLTNVLDREKGVSLVYSDYYEVDDEDNIIGLIQRKKLGDEVKFYDLPSHGACTLIRTDVLKKIGGYNEGVKRQDGYDLWIRFIQEHTPYNINVPLFFYRKHLESSTANAKKILEARRKIKEMFVEQQLGDETHKSLLVLPFRSKNVVENMFFQEIGDKTLMQVLYENVSEVNADIVVVSEDKDILKYFADLGVQVVQRPQALAQSGVLVQESVKYVLEKVDKEYDSVGIYFPTSPLVSSEHINEAFHTLRIFKADSVISVKESNAVLYRHSEYGLEPLVNKHTLLKSEREHVYEATGGIMIYTPKCLKDLNTIEKVAHIVLDDIESYDIEDKLTFWLVKKILENRNEIMELDNRKIKRGY